MQMVRYALVFTAYRKGYIMLSMYGILFSEIVLGVALMILLLAPNAMADMSADSSSTANSELRSDRSKTPTQPGQTDITNTPGNSNDLPSRYTIMPVARGQKIDVENELIGDTVTNPKGEPLGRLERLIKDSETQKIEYAMISIGDTDQYKAFPWSNFKVNKEEGNVVLNVTKGTVAAGSRTNRSLAGCDESGGRPAENAPKHQNLGKPKSASFPKMMVRVRAPWGKARRAVPVLLVRVQCHLAASRTSSQATDRARGADAPASSMRFSQPSALH